MSTGLNIRQDGALDFLSLGALVHRLDPGIIPFRKATECKIHVSGGEFNCAANLADCFGLKTGIATAMVDYPIGDLIAERVRAMGVKPFYKQFKHNGVNGPNMATVYSDQGLGVRAPVVFYNRSQRSGGAAEAGRFRLEGDLRRAACAGSTRGGIFAALSPTTAEVIIEAMQAAKEAGAVDVLRPELPRQAVEHLRRRRARRGGARPHREERGRPGGQRGGPAEGPRHSRTGSRGQIQARPERVLRHDRYRS